MKRLVLCLLPVVLLLGCESSTTSLVGLEEADAVSAAKSENGAIVNHDNESCTIYWHDPFFGMSLEGVWQRVLTPSGNNHFTCNAKMPEGALLPDKAFFMKGKTCLFWITPGGTTHATCHFKQ